jgi:acetyl-CoA acetyltransferase
MRDVAIISFAQADNVEQFAGNEIEMLLPIAREAVERSGLERSAIGFTTAASSDYLAGQAFAFVRALDAVGAYPVIDDSHVDMDGAWAFYEAWVRLQVGDLDSALIYALGKSSQGRPHQLMPLSLDPYYLAPLGIDPASLAALQARSMIDAGQITEADLAEVAARAHWSALENPKALRRGEKIPWMLLQEPYLASPLRAHDCPPLTDGAAAIVIATGDLARSLCERPVWIRGLAHCTESHYPGARDLTQSPSSQLAAEAAGVHDDKIDLAEIHAQFSHEEPLLRRTIGIGNQVSINPSGGPLCANPVMATGLIRMGEAARRIADGEADRAVAHASWGPCLQQNLVCVLEGD